MRERQSQTSQTPSDNFFLARLLKRTNRTKEFSPKLVKKVSEQYLTSMHFNQNKDLNCSHSLSDFETKRLRNATQFTSSKVGGHTLGDMFKETNDEAQIQLRDSINAALRLSEDYQAKSNRFTSIISEINRRAKNSPPNLDANVVASYLESEKNTMLAAIKNQFESENQHLTDLAKNPHFKEDVITHLNVPEDEYTSVMRAMLSDLSKDQKSQLATFEKALNQQIIAVRQQAQNERLRIAYIANLVNKNSKAKKFIRQITGSKNFEDNENALLHIKLEDMADAGALSALSGRKIDYNQSTKAFTYKFPKNNLWNVKYNFRRENLAQDDMRSIAEAVKACGHESIIMTVDHSNPKNAEEMARMAYQAARNAGFPADKISIQVASFNKKTGKKAANKVDIQQIFDKHPKWKKQIERNAQKLEDKRGPQAASNASKTREYRQKVAEFDRSIDTSIERGAAPAV